MAHLVPVDHVLIPFIPVPIQTFDAEFERWDHDITKAQSGISVLSQASETIRVHGLDTGLVAFLQADGYLARIAPDFPSVETLHTAAYTPGETAALRAAQYLDVAAEGIATSAINALRRSFALVAEKIGVGISTLGRWLRILAKKLRAAATESSLKAAQVSQQELQAVESVISDSGKMLTQVADAAANPEALARGAKQLNATAATIGQKTGEFVDKVPVLTTNVTKDAATVTVEMAENTAKAAAGAGTSAPAAIADAADNIAAQVEKLTIGQHIAKIWRGFTGMISRGFKWVLDYIRAIGRVIYWILNTVTFGALQWIRKKFGGVAAKVGAEAPVATATGDAAGAAAAAT